MTDASYPPRAERPRLRPGHPAVATVGSGDEVDFDCLDASNGQLTADSTTDDIATLVFDQVDQVTGPVAVEGAEPGDTLQVDLLEFVPADWGWTASIPGFGLVAEDRQAVARWEGPRGRTA